MQIIGYHIDRQTQTICNSNGESCSQPPYLEFLLKEHDAIRICYHLDFFTSNLLTFLKFNEKTLLKLHDTTEINVSGYKIKYVPKKFLSIIKDDEFIVLADASQYMERHDLIGDCVEKAKEACKIGVQVYNALSKLGLHPKSIVSPISVFDKEIYDKLNLPQFEDIPLEASEYAYNCCHGPWVEAFQRGSYNKVWDYDLSSAYPSILATECIDTRLGKWDFSTEYHANAYYGFCKGIVNITSDFSPIIYSKINEHSYTPKGEWETYITKQEIDFINKYNLGTFELTSGWWFFPDKIELPLKKMIEWLYQKKETATGMEKKIVKRIMSGAWGRCLQVDAGEVPGPYFNAPWGCIVEVETRLNVAKFIIENNLQNHILSIAVDGVLVDKEVKL